MRSKSILDRRSRSRSAERWISTRYAGMRALSGLLLRWPPRSGSAPLADYLGKRTRSLLAALSSLSSQEGLERVVQVLQLLDESSILIDIQQNGARLAPLREIERTIVAQSCEDIRHLCPEARHSHEFIGHRSIVHQTVRWHVHRLFPCKEKEARSGPGPLASKRLDDLVLAERRVESPSAVSGPGAVLEEAASAERIADGLIVVDDG